MALPHENNIPEPHGHEAVGYAEGGDDSSLEYFHNVLTKPIRAPDHYEIRKCGCSSWYCPDCASRRGYTLRAELIPILETFKGILLVTLTIDPKLFNKPLDALLYIREHTCIGILIQRLYRSKHLHSRRYFNVLEFQKNGFPHYHILLDSSFIPKSKLQNAWDQFRPKHLPPPEGHRPGFGATWISKSRFKGGAVHAARYATKYLTKVPDHGFPAWVMKLGASLRVPRYSTSKPFWDRPRKQQKKKNTSNKKRNPSLSYESRQEQCGASSNIFKVRSWIYPDGYIDQQRIWKNRVGISHDEYSKINEFHVPNNRATTIDIIENQSPLEAIRQAVGHPVPVIASSNKTEVDG